MTTLEIITRCDRHLANAKPRNCSACDTLAAQYELFRITAFDVLNSNCSRHPSHTIPCHPCRMAALENKDGD